VFAPTAEVRRVNAEGVVLLGGGRALLMQVAHPQVARGVVEHSSYQSDRLGRLQRTLRPMYAIAFGTPDEARTAAEGVRAVHQRVVGASYRADDPPLLGWVLATLIDTALLMYRRFIAPLAPHDAEAYYAGMRSIGALLGTPRSALPESLREFESYVAEMVATIDVSDDSRQIARELFAPVPGAPWLRPAMPLARELTAGLLPAHLREQYGMSWGPRREAALAGAARLSRTLRPVLPSRLTQPPATVMPQSYRQRRRRGF
jgi:uncharacterized protein (DUF2236 family)